MSIKSAGITDELVKRKTANKVTERLRCQPAKDDADYQSYLDAITVAQRWRSQHTVPTEACFQLLLDVAWQFPDAVLSFRLKRMKSILAKLRRPGKDYRLGTMDDIGGCRLILNDINQVQQVIPILNNQFELKQGRGVKDYIEKPRPSGYRSYHLITVNEGVGRSYRVEVQIRTRLQHLWSTAVEAASLIRGLDLKVEREKREADAPEREIREFFAIVSSLFSLEEGTPQVQGYCESKDVLVKRLSNLKCLDELLSDLSAIEDGVCIEDNGLQADRPSLYLLSLSRDFQFLNVDSYLDNIDDAIEAYNRSETGADFASQATGRENFDDVVLAYAENMDQLDLAFPNYFAKVGDFLARVKRYL